MWDFFGGIPSQAALPGLLGHFGDTVVEGLGTGGLLCGGHGRVVARVAFRQHRGAHVRHEQRALLEVVHREGEHALAVADRHQRAVEGIRVGVGRGQQLQTECGA